MLWGAMVQRLRYGLSIIQRGLTRGTCWLAEARGAKKSIVQPPRRLYDALSFTYISITYSAPSPLRSFFVLYFDTCVCVFSLAHSNTRSHPTTCCSGGRCIHTYAEESFNVSNEACRGAGRQAGRQKGRKERKKTAGARMSGAHWLKIIFHPMRAARNAYIGWHPAAP